MGRERHRADVRPHSTGHSGSSERAQKQPSMSSAAPHPRACLRSSLSWARGTAVISIQRAQGGAGSVLGSGHQALRSCRGSRLQPGPQGALGAGQSRAFQVASGAQDRRCCCQQGPPLDFSHGEMLRLQGNKVPCAWVHGGGRGPRPHCTFLEQVVPCGPETTPVVLHWIAHGSGHADLDLVLQKQALAYAGPISASLPSPSLNKSPSGW